MCTSVIKSSYSSSCIVTSLFSCCTISCMYVRNSTLFSLSISPSPSSFPAHSLPLSTLQYFIYMYMAFSLLPSLPHRLESYITLCLCLHSWDPVYCVVMTNIVSKSLHRLLILLYHLSFRSVQQQQQTNNKHECKQT